MVIREMSRDECLALLGGSSVLRLACARDDQPYVVPVSLALDAASGCLYGHTTLGRKIEWMRTNPRVCVEADEVTAQDRWMSVVAHGRYEEVAAPAPQGQTPGRAPERAEIDPTPAALRPPVAPPMGNEASFRKAFEILQRLPAWWQPGSAAWAARSHGGSTEPFVSIFYRIRLDAITGHAATPDAWAGIPSA
jgi:nitroimidazol reductase NimA-like FMN-containing flavoprotein (pyridoxamine 5'-phosphate oxidase superfamily)